MTHTSLSTYSSLQRGDISLSGKIGQRFCECSKSFGLRLLSWRKRHGGFWSKSPRLHRGSAVAASRHSLGRNRRPSERDRDQHLPLSWVGATEKAGATGNYLHSLEPAAEQVELAGECRAGEVRRGAKRAARACRDARVSTQPRHDRLVHAECRQLLHPDQQGANPRRAARKAECAARARMGETGEGRPRRSRRTRNLRHPWLPPLLR